jgi:hypothetical protein
VAMAELECKKGSQFDPKVVDSFLSVLQAQGDDYRRGTDVDFEQEVRQIRFLRDLAPESGATKVSMGAPFETDPEPHATHDRAGDRDR